MVPQKDEHGPNLGMKGQVRGRREEGSGGRRARPQEAPLPLHDQQAGGQHGVQGVRDLHLAPRRAQCRLFAAAARSTGRVVPFCHEMVLMSAEEKATAVSSQTRPSARGPSSSMEPVRGRNQQGKKYLIHIKYL